MNKLTTKSVSLDHLATRYRRFAELEAKGNSRLYEQLGHAVAESEMLLKFIAALPQEKQQPNIVFAGVRHLFGTPKGPRHFANLVSAHPENIRSMILGRSTQTNEPARCATLLPVLARLPQPLALLEVGAAAGLCLLPDYYRYDYGVSRLDSKLTVGCQPPTFNCAVHGPVPVPTVMPDIVWRAGLDLNPIDLADKEARRWLETLVWPGQPKRAARLRRAMTVTRSVQVPVEKADLLEDLSRVADAAPKDATLVIFHSAVLAYVKSEISQQFAERVRGIDAVWISNEHPSVTPWLETAPKECGLPGDFLLCVDRKPVAYTGPHGQYIKWLENAAHDLVS